MKKFALALLPILMIFTACDGVNLDIDDLPRTLRISVKTLQETDDTWNLLEDANQIVTTGAGNNIASGTVGTVRVTAGVKDDFVRGDVVTVQADNGSLEFAYWMLPSRSDELSDPLSTEGNIRYGLDAGSIDVSLRTDYKESEIFGAFAKDGNTGLFSALTLLNSYVDDNTTAFLFDMAPVANETIANPRFRLFDDQGEARTDWLDFYDISSANESVAISFGSPLTIRKEISGILDGGVLDNWNVIVIYEEPDDNNDVYVVK